MLVNGKAIAEDIKERLKKEIKGRIVAPTLFIFSVGVNSVSENFLNIKKRFGSDIGFQIVEKRFEDIDTTNLIREINSVAQKENSGIIVQLPLPKSIDPKAVLNAVPWTRDVDVLSEQSFELYKEGTLPILPPVIGAMKEILFRHNVFVGNKDV